MANQLLPVNSSCPGEIQLYESSDGTVQLKVLTDKDTVWLTRQQMASLFGRDVKTIGKHTANAQREELAGIPTVAKFATVQREGDRLVERQVEHYNIDMVLSVGYRVKSREGVKFRQWSNRVLNQYVMKGAAINQQRLEQIGETVRILSRSTDVLVAGAADVLSTYLPGLELLREYDAGKINVSPNAKPGWKLTITETRTIIAKLRLAFPDDDLLGNEPGNGLEAAIGAIYQSFGGEDLYPTVEEKAANLLYLVVKDHPLLDGNKRTAAALFVTFLDHNGILDDAEGKPRISSNALAALTLMVSMSDPREKNVMITLIVRMIAKEQIK
jgi:prophage maintenance system killer protein